ncbi:hypothetical protein [Streptomyces sp. NPDC000931]|uniref:hypothetical protein n=1 Tax=Streptomyces sp. NPDC000931 TaxID=3154372 RepID=UPI003327B78D
MWQQRELTDAGRAQVDRPGGTLCVTGKHLFAFDLVRGKELWSTDSPKLPNGEPAFWSSPTIDGRVVYATEVVLPVQLDIRTGKTTDRPRNSPKPCPQKPRAFQAGAVRTHRCRQRL